jgi:hypothetical protein
LIYDEATDPKTNASTDAANGSFPKFNISAAAAAF